jgi:hypothetical protein
MVSTMGRGFKGVGRKSALSSVFWPPRLHYSSAMGRVRRVSGECAWSTEGVWPLSAPLQELGLRAQGCDEPRTRLSA